MRMKSYPKERHGGATHDGSVGDVSLLGEVLCRLDGGDHPLDGEEGCQVGGVRGDNDESKEPPDTANNPTTSNYRVSTRISRETSHDVYYLVEMALGLTSQPCCMSVPTANQKLLERVNTFSTTSESPLHG